MALAHTVGAVCRALGRSARDLDPLHRRDGLGLTALVAAIVAAVATWWQASGPIKPLSTALVSLLGSGSWTVPILLALLGWRFLRHPDKNADTARMVIGWTALLVGALGLLHVASGTPGFSRGHGSAGGLGAIRSAGGLLGYAASAPLVHVLTKWAATPVLALVAGFGLLVITGTPLHRVPDRLAELHGFARRRDADADGKADGQVDAAGQPRQLARLGKRRQEALEVGARDRAYDTPLLGGILGRGQAGSAKDAPRGDDGAGASAADAAAASDALAFSAAGPERASRRGRLARSMGTGRRSGRARAWHRRRDRSGRRPVGQVRAAHPGCRYRRQLHAAAGRAAQAGHGAQGADQGQRRNGRCAVCRA